MCNGGADTRPDLGRRLLQKHQESLEHQVGEAGPDGHVVQQALDVVHHHAAELRLVGVVKHLAARKERGGGQRSPPERTAEHRLYYAETSGGRANILLVVSDGRRWRRRSAVTGFQQRSNSVHLFDRLALGDLRVSNHFVWRADLNEGEL